MVSLHELPFSHVCSASARPHPTIHTCPTPVLLSSNVQEASKARRGAPDTLRTLLGVLGDQLLYLSETAELLAVGNVIAASSGDLESVVGSAIAALNGAE